MLIFQRPDRLKSLVSPAEPLTPSLLYVGVATLTGSVLARNRGVLLRAALPPSLLVLSFAHFLPQTAHNVRTYLGALEDTYAPGLAEKHEIGKAHTAMTWARVREATHDSRARLSSGVVRLVDRFQEATGLKLREALGVQAGETKKTPQIVEAVEKKVEAAQEDVKEAVETKKEEVKRLL